MCCFSLLWLLLHMVTHLLCYLTLLFPSMVALHLLLPWMVLYLLFHVLTPCSPLATPPMVTPHPCFPFFFKGTSKPPFYCYSLVVIPSLLVATPYLCFFKWNSFPPPFFLISSLWRYNQLAKANKQDEFFLKTFHTLIIFRKCFSSFQFFCTMLYNLIFFKFCKKEKKDEKLFRKFFFK